MSDENVKIIDEDEVNLLMTSDGNWGILEFFYIPTIDPEKGNLLKEVEKELETKPYVYVKSEELQTIFKCCAYRRD